MTDIRTATLDDLDALVPLLDGYRVFYGQNSHQAAAREFLHQRLTQGDSHLLVHDSGAGPDGFVQLYPLLSTVSLAPRWLLNDLFVDPEARGRGTGRALMNAAAELANAHGVPGLMLRTQTHNHTAKALYASLGWQCDRAFENWTLKV
ncbi:GNAT family N-acetyltransferase [Kushneria aurantia]|uniref:GNAT family N-acetyltransferase n=1 Tax=Kushneria aurantia TaxID=504092 RepID=A0ABV6G3B6_9GAMM|nr:GNAT family N-acetyltransferase [Kushneria aurantia]